MAVDLAQKKILITGADGFLGKHVVRNLLEQRRVPRENLFLPRKKDLDLRILENCRKAVEGREIVFHLAANIGGIGHMKENPGEIFYDNVVMGVQLMEAARLAGVQKFLVVSSASAYPKSAQVPFKEEDLWAGYPDEVTAAYGLSKRMLLVQGLAYFEQYGFKSIFLIPTNMYGPENNFDPKRSGVLAALVKKFVDAKNNGTSFVEIWGTGTATREFLFVDDAAEGLALAAEQYEKPDPVNLGNGKETSIKALAQLIAKLCKFQGEIRWDASKPDGPPRRSLDISKAKQEFGFEAKTSLEEGLMKTIAWYEKNNHVG
ncbi:MAG: NAD-dependent epimerase/dehydratase family protein [Candidatus Wildermuthbacteria bacterium]|nr:NAD-dependent epimerase/dehydratase family protein [Candidatus Wildermuthbacteria bacterium]